MPESMPADVSRQLRIQMPVVESYAYFDHAAVAPLPQPTAQAMLEYVQQASWQGDVPWMSWAAQVKQLRARAAEFLCVSQDEIALVNSTTQGIGLVAEGFPWQAGDNVVVPENEFPSNIVPWQALARRGVELRRVPVSPSGVIELASIAEAMDGRTKIVSLSWVGFVSGYRIDVAEVADLVHSRGALLMLDAIQGLGAFPLDCSAAGVDFLAADGHKWMLGPEGAGVFYVRGEHLNLLQPLGLGWNSLQSAAFDPRSSKIKSTAARYEGGSTNMVGMIGLNASLKLLSELHGGPDAEQQQAGREPSSPPRERRSAQATSPVEDAILHNVEMLCDRLDGTSYRPLVAPERHRSGIVCLDWHDSARSSESRSSESRSSEPRSSEPRAWAAREFCLSRGVVLSVRGGRLRVATHAYNDQHDIERLVEALMAFDKTI